MTITAQHLDALCSIANGRSPRCAECDLRPTSLAGDAPRSKCVRCLTKPRVRMCRMPDCLQAARPGKGNITCADHALGWVPCCAEACVRTATPTARGGLCRRHQKSQKGNQARMMMRVGVAR